MRKMHSREKFRHRGGCAKAQRQKITRLEQSNQRDKESMGDVGAYKNKFPFWKIILSTMYMHSTVFRH